MPSDLSPETGPDPAAATAADIARRLRAGDATVAVVGLGYVGLPVASAFVAAGMDVIGFDIDPAKIEAIARGEKYLRHVPDAEWSALTASERFRGTTDPTAFAQADAVLLCVPTPLRAGEEDAPSREPDLSYVESSARTVAAHVRPGTLVVLESTTYPGTTRTLLAPIFEEAGLVPGSTVHLAFSPERTDPGRTDLPTVEVPRLVGGLDAMSRDLTTALYRHAYAAVHPVRSAEVAEAAKLLENVYRSVNIALVNELKLILERMGIDVWEVIEAAATKPYGFEAFRPGPGLGGHCIPIDPFYLTWAAERVGFPTRFIELAGEINTAMPAHVVAKLAAALTDGGAELAGARVLVLGVAYKRDVGDTRETPAAEIIAKLRARGADVTYHDPWVPRFPPMRRHAIDLASVDLTEDLLAATDAVVIVTDHSAIDWGLVARAARLVVDTRNALAGRDVRGRVVKA